MRPNLYPVFVPLQTSTSATKAFHVGMGGLALTCTAASSAGVLQASPVFSVIKVCTAANRCLFAVVDFFFYFYWHKYTFFELPMEVTLVVAESILLEPAVEKIYVLL